MHIGITESATRRILEEEMAKTGLVEGDGLVLFGGEHMRSNLSPLYGFGDTVANVPQKMPLYLMVLAPTGYWACTTSFSSMQAGSWAATSRISPECALYLPTSPCVPY